MPVTSSSSGSGRGPAHATREQCSPSEYRVLGSPTDTAPKYSRLQANSAGSRDLRNGGNQRLDASEFHIESEVLRPKRLKTGG